MITTKRIVVVIAIVLLAAVAYSMEVAAPTPLQEKYLESLMWHVKRMDGLISELQKSNSSQADLNWLVISYREVRDMMREAKVNVFLLAEEQYKLVARSIRYAEAIVNQKNFIEEELRDSKDITKNPIDRFKTVVFDPPSIAAEAIKRLTVQCVTIYLRLFGELDALLSHFDMSKLRSLGSLVLFMDGMVCESLASEVDQEEYAKIKSTLEYAHAILRGEAGLTEPTSSVQSRSRIADQQAGENKLSIPFTRRFIRAMKPLCSLAPKASCIGH